MSALGVYTSHPVDRILDTRLSKHYLSTTSFADGNDVNVPRNKRQLPVNVVVVPAHLAFELPFFLRCLAPSLKLFSKLRTMTLPTAREGSVFRSVCLFIEDVVR